MSGFLSRAVHLIVAEGDVRSFLLSEWGGGISFTDACRIGMQYIHATVDAHPIILI